MAESTAIQWCDATWSPWEGCTKVSPGCDHCYAERQNRWLKKGANWGPGAPRREYSDDHWRKPLRWNAKAAAEGRRLRVFPSVCDPFDNEVPDAWRARFFSLISVTPSIDWLLLTKRIGNAKAMLDEVHRGTDWEPAQNVWIGATMVNQAEIDRDMLKLLAVPAEVRFISAEPLLSDLELSLIGTLPKDITGSSYEAVYQRLHWVIVGGESGPGARPTTIGHIRGVVRQCRDFGVPVFVKQLGARPVNREGVPHPITDPKGGDPAEWPEDLRVREMPA